MRGIRMNIQNRILERYPRAFYAPGACHPLNLVLNGGASSTETTISFLQSRTLHFLSGSTKRWEVLIKYVPELTLKSLH